MSEQICKKGGVSGPTNSKHHVFSFDGQFYLNMEPAVLYFPGISIHVPQTCVSLRQEHITTEFPSISTSHIQNISVWIIDQTQIYVSQ
jgi:hypothetical protein